MELYILPTVKYIASGKLPHSTGRSISSALCNHLEGWDKEGGREMQKE